MTEIYGPMKILAGAVLALALVGGGTAAWAQKGSVVYYNSGGAKLARAMVKDFNKKYPDITVEVINAGTGELLTRIKAESKNPRGDVFRGAVEAFDAEPGLFESYKTKDHDKFPADTIGKDNKFYGYNTAIMMFIVNTKLLPLDKAPKSWKDLAKPAYKGQIIWAHPSLSGSGARQLAQMIQLHGWGHVAKVIGNSVVVPKSRLVFTNVAKGEGAIGMTEESKVYRMKGKGYPVEAVYPSEGVGMSYGSVGLIKGGPNGENARIFADFHNSYEGHMIGVKVLKRRSPRPDVPAPKDMPATKDVTFFEYDRTAETKDRDSNIRRFDEHLNKQ
jgi:iron(III) transport system substrate-binding protein